MALRAEESTKPKRINQNGTDDNDDVTVVDRDHFVDIVSHTRSGAEHDNNDNIVKATFEMFERIIYDIKTIIYIYSAPQTSAIIRPTPFCLDISRGGAHARNCTNTNRDRRPHALTCDNSARTQTAMSVIIIIIIIISKLLLLLLNYIIDGSERSNNNDEKKKKHDLPRANERISAVPETFGHRTRTDHGDRPRSDGRMVRK